MSLPTQSPSLASLRRLLLLLTALLVGVDAPAAQSVQRLDRTPRSYSYTVHRSDEASETVTVDLHEEVRVIVQFTEEPLSRIPQSASRGERLSTRSTAEAQHARFLSDLSAITSSAGQSRGTPTARVHHTFVTAINGVAVTVPRGTLGGIRSLDYVTRVDEDRRVQSFASPGAISSGPPASAYPSASTGEGIVIAIVDSGVDYTHPALGGGIGAGFKVIGGYDFISDDPDPMDENGHGTHVAGIAAGNGSGFTGVAPDARLLAFRVLDAGGGGDLSTVIAGIEAAVDPNGDGLFDDRAHVINLSLGGPGDADDPGATAVDNAVGVGSVVVLAAGNEGAYMTVGSPASARLGVTVGAHDSALAIAPFSSRGPASGSFGLKPDVLAPGVDINSTWPGSGFQVLSGTSMAAPYVAGVAALLLEEHPGWTPEVVKSALMSTAQSIGEDLYTEGAGRVRVVQAAAVSAATTPSFSFGLVDAEAPVWASEAPLQVRNVSETTRTFDLSVAAGLPAGVSVTVSPSTVTVPSGGTGTATVTVTLDNGQVPFAPVVPPTLVGHVVAQSGSETVRMPFGMVKTTFVRVEWEEEPGQIWFIGQDEPFVASYLAPPSGGIILVPPGEYTIAAPYVRFEGEDVVSVVNVKEQVEVAAGTLVEFREQDLGNVVRLVGRTHTGSPAPVYMTDYVLHLPGAGGGLLLSGNTLSDRLRTSDIANATLDAAGFALSDTRDDYVSVHRLSGISASVTLTPDPTAYRRVDLDYVVPPGVTTLVRQPGFTFDVLDDQATAFVNVYTHQQRFELRAPFRQTRYVTPAPAGSPYRAFSELVMDKAVYEAGGQLEDALHIAPSMSFSAGETTVHRGNLLASPAYTTSASPHTVAVGMAPPLWFGRLVRSDDHIVMNNQASDAFFLGATYGRLGGTVDYRVTRAGEVVASHEVPNAFTFPPTGTEVGPGATVRLVHSGHRVLEREGTARVQVTFDARPADPNPPRMADLQVRAGGVPSVALPESEANTILLALADESPVGPVTVEVQRLASGTWERIGSLEGAGPHEVSVPSSLTPGYYGLRVTAADAPSGSAANRMDYRSDVAFAYRPRPLAQNGQPSAPQLQLPANDTVLDPATAEVVTFSWSASGDPDAGDQLSYALRFYGPGVDTTLTAWSTTEAVLDLSELLQPEGVYQWSVTTSDGFAVVEAPQAFRILTPGAVDAEPGGTPLVLSLEQNYPNPFQSATTFAFTLAEDGPVRLTVYDLLGRRVATLVSDTLPAGPHTARWDAVGAASGTYIYTLEAGGTSQARRLVLTR